MIKSIRNLNNGPRVVVYALINFIKFVAAVSVIAAVLNLIDTYATNPEQVLYVIMMLILLIVVGGLSYSSASLRVMREQHQEDAVARKLQQSNDN